MKNQRITSIIYFCFSLLVSVYSIYLGRIWVCFFVLPFVPAILIPGRCARYFEFAGLSVITFLTLIVFNTEPALIMAVVLSMLFYTLTLNKKAIYIFWAINAVIIFICCLLKDETFFNKPFAAAMYVCIYLVATICAYVYISEIKRQEQEILPCDPIVLKALDEAMSLLHESTEQPKHKQEEENGRN